MNTIDPAAYEGDIVSRLRHWRGLHLAHCGPLFEAAATEIEVQRACTSAARDEIERLHTAIRRIADQDATLSVQDGSVTVTVDATLTAEEREAIYRAEARLRTAYVPDDQTANTLRSLLERLRSTPQTHPTLS